MGLTCSSMTGVHGLDRFPLKQLIVWGDHLKVGQPQIDIQHQEIFNLAFEIEATWHNRGSIDKIKALCEKLSKVLESHFRYEEQQLANIDYAKFDEHCSEHKVLLQQLQSIRDRFEGAGDGNIQMEPGLVVMSFVLGVTVGHIFHSDMDYKAFAKRIADEGVQAWKAD